MSQVVSLNDPFMPGPSPVPDGVPGMPPLPGTEGGSMSIGQAAALMEKESASPVPVMDKPPMFHVELPAGWISPNGLLVQSAEVRELNGYAEERLSRLDMAKNVAQYVTELLMLGLVSIGSEPATREMVRNLLIGDRDALVLGIRKATYGDEIDFTLNCTTCDEESEIKVSIDDDIEVIKLDPPNERIFDVQLRNGSAKVMLLNGVAQEAFSENIGKKTQAEINTIMLAKSVVEINGNPVRGRDDPVRALSAGDRSTITDFIAERQPGPQFKEIKVPCATCGTEYPISLGLPSLFRF
jgi:hypothetical protein